ncbi:helix-turn-helix domain-containing protein [Paenibacillus eucommiae]|uniref:AraC-like DNA-binding protein n=1 Tax=Paenibacillus eucommiae TaxID=1355755 RepID=A0ABS4J1V3_9BACL|nr:helix-turn-helix domain-containing protein [Paenibacillus eucommiae]MBP1993819.1 AraC-like DNA-binding protein [Paenibacillus eucommiae]
MRNNWFYKLLLSYLPVFLIISSSILLMTYLSLIEMSKKSATRAHQALTQNVMLLIDQTLGGVNAFMQNEMLNNEHIKHFFDERFSEDRQYTDIQAAVALKKQLLNNSLIESIYLYRAPDLKILTPSTLTRIDFFADNKFIGLMLNSHSAYNWTLRTLPSQEAVPQNEVKVVSLTKKANLSNFSIMVVNVRIERLRELMESMTDTGMAFINLTDPDGNLIVSTETDAESGIPASKSGKILSSTHSDYTNWIISSGNRSGGIVELVSSLFYVWMAIALMSILAGLAWIIYISRRNYRPIETLMNRISGVRQMRNPDRMKDGIDEFELIETTIEDLLDESSMLQEQYKEASLFRKKHMFTSLMEGMHSDQNRNWEDELEQLGVSGPVSGSLVALVEIDQYDEFAGQYGSDQHLLKYVLSNVAKEVTVNHSFTVWTEWMDHSQMAILYVCSDHRGTELDVRACCETLRNWVANNLDFTITIGIGERTEGLRHVAESFRTAAANIGYKTSLGQNRIITTDQVMSRPKGELFKQLQCIRAVSQLFRAGDNGWETQFQEMYADLQGQLYTYDDLSNLMQVLIGHLQKDMAELPEDLNAVWHEGVHESLLTALESKKTLDDIHAAFHRILKDVFIRMNELRESKSNHQLVHHVKNYISENYHNPELSLTHLGEAFGMNTKSVSRSFREVFGVKFIEYITEVRMEKAEQLLLDTEETIQKIGQAVGYEQSLTFIRVFKKHTGETPGQYRKRAKTAHTGGANIEA